MWMRLRLSITGASAFFLLVTLVTVAHAPYSSALGPEPAFYTYQAPGGSATAGRHVIALTFDDGPGPYTPQVLSVLERFHVPATFFEIGENIVEYPQYTRMLAVAGYPVEDHTWTHPDLATIPVSDFPYEIDQTQSEIRSLTGVTPSCVRPPYDAWDSTVLDQIAERGLTTMSYSIDPVDWTLPGTEAIVDNVVGAAFPGAVVDMHDGGGNRSETVAALPEIITDLEGEGYTFVSICGPSEPATPPQTSVIFSFGNAPAPGKAVTSEKPLVGVATDPEASGYWLVAQDGGLFAFGAAGFCGSLPELKVTPVRPVVGIAATADGRGYWLVASDGGVFAFGDAVFYGSMGGRHLNAAIVGIEATPDRKGYWLVAADGGIFSFGDARFLGSLPQLRVRPVKPIVGLVSASNPEGYWMVGSDGGVFAFGEAQFHGSLAASNLDSPVVGMAEDAATGGYWLAGSDGWIFGFTAPFYGSVDGHGTGDQFFGLAAQRTGLGYIVAGEHPVTSG